MCYWLIRNTMYIYSLSVDFIIHNHYSNKWMSIYYSERLILSVNIIHVIFCVYSSVVSESFEYKYNS